MRIDKYLKITRLIKRRTIAKEIVDNGLIFVNGKQVKPSKEISVGDVVELHLGKHKLVIQVLNLSLTPRKGNCDEMYKILEDKVINTPDVA